MKPLPAFIARDMLDLMANGRKLILSDRDYEDFQALAQAVRP